MPAYRNTFDIPARTPTCVTPNGPHAAVRLQSQGSYPFHVQAGDSGTVAPVNLVEGSILVESFGGFSAERTLVNLFPGALAGTTGYLWVLSESEIIVSVSANA